MPDWRHEIILQLAGLKLSPACEAEIVEEVAQHLEDRYRELLTGGTSATEARRVIGIATELVAGGIEGVGVTDHVLRA